MAIWRIALAALSLLGGSTATGQEVRNFIDPARANAPPKFNSPEDREFLKAFAKGIGASINNAGELYSCQWRAPLASRGGYVDAAPERGMQFYARIPFPRAGFTTENITLPNRQELAAVPYLELRGGLDTDGHASWEFVALVLPPMAEANGRMSPAFTAATMTFGGYAAHQIGLRQTPPGGTVRVSIGDYMPDILAALRSSPAVTLKMSRFEAATAPTGPRVTVNGSLPMLETDIITIFAKLRWMATENRAGRCKVLASDCFDGSCG